MQINEQEVHTMDEVLALAADAKAKGIKFTFYPVGHVSLTWDIGHGDSAWIYDDMTPTQMWNEIARAMIVKKLNPFLSNVLRLRAMVDPVPVNSHPK